MPAAPRPARPTHGRQEMHGQLDLFGAGPALPEGFRYRADVISANLYAAGPIKGNTVDMSLNIEGKARPLFAYTYQTIDDVQGNNDGQVQRGERVRLLIKVKNIGAGPAIKTESILRNGPGQEGILISAGRFDAKDLAPGATKNVSFIYEVGSDFKGDEYQLELMVADTVLGESVTDKIKIKVGGAPIAVQPGSGAVTVTAASAPLREAAVDGALVVGRAPKGSAFKVTGKAGNFVRVQLEENRPAYLAVADVQTGGTASPAKATFTSTWQVSPPIVAVTAPTAVTGPTVNLKGTVTDDNQVKDLFVRVYNRDSKMPPKKVYYLPNTGDKTKLSFDTNVQLWPGSNIVQVFARETNEVQTVATVVVLQRPNLNLAQNVIPETAPAATGAGRPKAAAAEPTRKAQGGLPKLGGAAESRRQ